MKHATVAIDNKHRSVREAVNRTTKALLGLLLFIGVSAAAGGVALMTDWIPEQASWVQETDFPSNYFPGVILMAVVGGSSLIAAAALAKRSDGWQLASIVAGTIMVFWISGGSRRSVASNSCR